MKTLVVYSSLTGNTNFEYTLTGVFWGNSIDAQIVEKVIEIRLEKR